MSVASHLNRFTLKAVLLVLLGISLIFVFAGSQNAACAQSDTAEQEKLNSFDENNALQAMQLTSKAFRVAAEKIRPSLVTIESFAGVSAVQGKIGGIRKQGEGNTTGVMISNEGHIITSTFNFIQRPPVITVITSDGERRFATMLGRDDSRKLCVLKIDEVAGLTIPKFQDPEKLKLGQWVVSLGVGYGDTNPAMSIGIISATNRIGGRGIQTDANISPANYGGPLIDIDGNIVGICVPMHPQSQAIGAGVEWYDSGIGFAVPLFGKEKWLERLKNGERIFPAYVGIQAVPNQAGNGVVVEKVVEKSPAAEAGIKRMERIVELNGQPVNDLMRFKQLLNRFEAGTEIELVIVTDPDDNLSDDVVIERQKQGLPPVIPGGKRTVKIKLAPPPASQNSTTPMEPPKIR